MVIDDMNIIETIEDFCLSNKIFVAHESLLIACSGGPDSMALVDILGKLAVKYDLKLAVAHAEHGIRAQDSLADAKYVQAYCKEHKLPFYLEHLQVIDFAKKNKYSIETAARILRYRFLRKIKQQVGAAKILTAHHMNDQAETILQHLMRGCGSDGFIGMKAINEKGDIARPFLEIMRKDIELYCKKHNINPRLDKTNDSLEYERNRIRLELLPQMETYNPQIVKALCQSAKLVAQEHDFIKIYTEKIYVSICEAKQHKVAIDIAKLQTEHKAVRYSLYRYIIQKIQGDMNNISLIHIDNIDKFLYNGHVGLILQLPADLKIHYQYGKLVFVREHTATIATYKVNLLAKIDEPMKLPDGQIIEIKVVPATFAIKGRNHCFVDADKIKGELIVRSRQAGDKITPKGMNGSKKIKDIFIDNKIPAPLRSHIPLVCDEQGIIWIAGVQQDVHYLVDENSKRIFYLKIYN